MVSKVALVELGGNVQESFNQALKLIGGIDDLNKKDRSVVVKVGVFDPKAGHHSSVAVVDSIVNSFDLAPKIFLAESDNYRGKGSERLQIWKELFSKRVVPFSLSEDTDTRVVKVADEQIGLSHILFKPNVFVSTHVLRVYERGSVLKNLLGLVPDKKKVRFHKKLDAALMDMYEAVGGIDLAVLDGSYLSAGVAPSSEKFRSNIIVIGRDAVAVETVGAVIVGMEPEKMPIIQEAVRRGLGEGDMSKIKVLGGSVETFREKFGEQLREAEKRKRKASANTKKKT
jgi:uncharacterized protein (DUF362 family)